MTNPTHADFDATSINVMNDIAKLVQAAQMTRSMGPTFKNSPDLDHAHGKVLADKVVAATEGVAADLLSALFKSKRERENHLLLAQTMAKKKLRIAIKHAKELAEMETSGMGKSGGKGNIFKLKVVAPLQSVWN